MPVFLASWLGCQDSTTDKATMVIEGEPECQDCQITFAEVARLGGITDPASVRPDAHIWPCMVAKLHNSYLVSGVVGGELLLRYSNRGEFAGSIGRGGQGPGEFGQNILVATLGDAIHVVEHSTRAESS